MYLFKTLNNNRMNDSFKAVARRIGRRVLILIGVVWGCSLCVKAQDLDSLYRAFEHGRGEAAYRAAVAIDEVIGR